MSISRAEMLRFWPAEQLRRWPPAELTGLGLAGEAQHVLGEVGLPAHAPMISFAACRPQRSGRFVRVGTDGGLGDDGDFSVEVATGHLWAYTGTDLVAAILVNTALTRFAESLHAVARLCATHAGDALTDALDETLAAIDRPALRETEACLWHTVIETAAAGGY
jgi:hypothetical protein